jgi:DNA-binding NtrC family response regulator
MNEVIPEGDLPTLEQLEASYLLRVLGVVGGNKSRAAQVMGVDRKTLYRMIERQANAATNGKGSDKKKTAVPVTAP